MQEMWVQSLGQEDPREGHGNPLQYSCLGESMDRGAGWPSPWGREELAYLSHARDSLLSPLIISSGQNTVS